MKKLISILLSVILLLLWGCSAAQYGSPAEGAAGAAVDSITLYPAAANMPVGRELKLKAAIFPVGTAAVWESSDENVASVDEDGKVVAKSPGECTIIVTADGKSAQCEVLVEEDCRTVIFASTPTKGDGENPPQPPEGVKGEPPIELPPEVTDVDKIPKSDEFIWTLEFDETFSTLVINEGIPLIVDVVIAFKAEKQGGKTALGSYNGTFSGDADLDRDNFLKVMNEQMAGEGGKLTDYTETDEGIKNSPVVVEITAMDNAAYHEVMVGHIPQEERSVTQQLPIPISALFPGSMMALGEVSGMASISGTMTMEAMGQSITAPFGASENALVPYTICIYPSGEAVLTFPTMARDGFDRNWVQGLLTKHPLT